MYHNLSADQEVSCPDFLLNFAYVLLLCVFSVQIGYGAGWTEDREKTFIVPPPKVIRFLLTLSFIAATLVLC